jgi:hypothetical protein
MYSLALIIFVVSEKKAFEYFPIGPYGENVSKRFFSETTWTIETKLPFEHFPIGSNVNLCIAV